MVTSIQVERLSDRETWLLGRIDDIRALPPRTQYVVGIDSPAGIAEKARAVEVTT